jgi:kynurenine formamidase
VTAHAVSAPAPYVRYDELPVLPASGVRHAWDVFGRDDALGTLNRLTDGAVQGAAQLVQSGRRIGLSLPLELPDPPLFGRQQFTHEVFAQGRNEWDERVDNLYSHASTQWDGLQHVRAREDGFYAGIDDDPRAGSARLGIDHWARIGIVGRGVLIDVAAHAEQSGDWDPFGAHAVEAGQVQEVLAAQGSTLREGDILCLRFGWVDRYLELAADERRSLAERLNDPARRAWAGLRADEATARFLWDSGAAAIACDNPAVEVAPGNAADGSLHRRLIPGLGFALGELFDLGELSRTCSELGRFEFLFASIPLNITGAVGSPAAAVAVF